ncbi:IS3 family transposase [Streptacidiphilus sp. P02-A3a]|uniref:IS3 family transposase n=1 Tax=Streptacidiphilus sp. P02-A3a TaxID=2704468 RepID=UPI001CDBF09D|nr:IS3 family transposase [Streptacidiphilus sp. P02-A3a]
MAVSTRAGPWPSWPSSSACACRSGAPASAGTTPWPSRSSPSSSFSILKRELISTRTWPTRAAAHNAIFDFIEGWFNLHRLHSSLGYLSPNDYEALHAA